jgi:hypothetical protein
MLVIDNHVFLIINQHFYEPPILEWDFENFKKNAIV